LTESCPWRRRPYLGCRAHLYPTHRQVKTEVMLDQHCRPMLSAVLEIQDSVLEDWDSVVEQAASLHVSCGRVVAASRRDPSHACVCCWTVVLGRLSDPATAVRAPPACSLHAGGNLARAGLLPSVVMLAVAALHVTSCGIRTHRCPHVCVATQTSRAAECASRSVQQCCTSSGCAV
jgi:hypothetical protein